MFLLHSSSFTLPPLQTIPDSHSAYLVSCCLTWKASSISTIPPGRALCR